MFLVQYRMLGQFHQLHLDSLSMARDLWDSINSSHLCTMLQKRP